MRWFTTFPSWLYHESQELGNNSNYKQDHQFAERTLISSGCVLVHKENTQCFPILVVYPDATPYIPPIVFLLKDRIDTETARSLSAIPPSEIASRIRDRVRLLNRRHQNADGSICFLERGDILESQPERFKINEILTRVRAWLAGHVPVDSVEAELFAHFGNRCPEIQYLLPDIFFDPELVKGEFYAGLASLVRWNQATDSQKTYMGVYIVGANVFGVSLPPKIYARKELILFTRLPDVGKLIAGASQDLEKGVADGTSHLNLSHSATSDIWLLLSVEVIRHPDMPS
jgi:hypothetical protein